MEHQEQQLRKFGNTYRAHRDLKPGVVCELKKHFKSGTITRELAGWIDGMAASNRYRFVYAKPKAMAAKCHHWQDGKKNGTAKLRTIEYALELFEALGLIAYCTLQFKGAMRRGFVVLDHSFAATRDKSGCDLRTLGTEYSQHFFAKPGLPPLPRRGGRRDSKWKKVQRTSSARLAALGAAGAQSSAQSSAQSLGENAKASAQTSENGCAIGCAIEGEQTVDNIKDATSDPKFGLQFGGAEPLVKVKREPKKPSKPAGTPPANFLFDQRQTNSKGASTANPRLSATVQSYIERSAQRKREAKASSPAQPRKSHREPRATCSEEFEGLFEKFLTDPTFFSIVSDDEFNYMALDNYPQKAELRLACAQAAASMGAAPYVGRVTNARVMADAMGILKTQGITAPRGWYPAIKLLRAPYQP
jgi:hypothetical protein